MARLDSLKRMAASEGIALNALCGDPSWARAPETARRWAQEVRASGRFSRLHLDIEPYADPSWSAQSRSLGAGHIAALSAARSSGMPVDADIPYWYQHFRTTGGTPLDVAVVSVVDSITIMAYQDTASKILQVAGPEMLTAAHAGKKAYVGVNIARPDNDGPTSSLWNQPSAQIRTAISRVERQGRLLPAFAGVAVHDARTLRTVIPQALLPPA